MEVDSYNDVNSVGQQLPWSRVLRFVVAGSCEDGIFGCGVIEKWCAQTKKFDGSGEKEQQCKLIVEDPSKLFLLERGGSQIRSTEAKCVDLTSGSVLSGRTLYIGDSDSNWKELSSAFITGCHCRSRKWCCLWLIVFFFIMSILSPGVYSLGSMASISASYSNSGEITVCGIMQGAKQSIQCWRSISNSVVGVLPNSSFSGVSGGKGVFCGLLHDTLRPFCWDANNTTSPRRLENNLFSQIVVGESSVCGLLNQSTANGSVHCWRNKSAVAIPPQETFTSLAAGGTFTCGLKTPNSTVGCWGYYDTNAMPNTTTFLSIQAGGQHSCGITSDYVTYCWGNNVYGQSMVPSTQRFVALALGARHSCGLLASSHQALCWGDNSSAQIWSPASLSFYTLVAGDLFTCGMVETNFSIFCWGNKFGTGKFLPFNTPNIPAFCTMAPCESDTYALANNPNVSGRLICDGSSSYHVCVPCRVGCPTGYYESSKCGINGDLKCSPSGPSPGPSVSISPTAPHSSPNSVSSPSTAPQSAPSTAIKYINRTSILVITLGSLGGLIGVLSVVWCIWSKFYGTGLPSWRCSCTCNGGQGRVHNSSNSTGAVAARPSTASRKMRRQRSSASSYSYKRSRSDIAAAQAFSYAELAAATNEFSEENKIGAGSFGSVYKGELSDGREVAIKRGDREVRATAKKVAEKESAFQSELEFLSRLHHKHLVSLVGYCDEDDERMLVYDYMPNGTLHDHLHKKETETLSWHMRIKVALEAARGIEYLHTYAMPPIIHRDIKSSNILLDSSWSARVSDFGLSLMGPADETSHLSLMAAGTVGYMDPEYYRLQHLTAKSDVYSFGVVLLEILTGLRAIHKQSTGPINVVDFAVPHILSDDVLFILDPKPKRPEPIEMEALSVLAEVAEQCVRLEGKERPNTTEIVNRLEHAMALSRANQKMQARNKGIPEIVESS